MKKRIVSITLLTVLATTEVRSRSQKCGLGTLMDSANLERISKALANETRLLIFEAIARNKEMTSNAILPSYSCLK